MNPEFLYLIGSPGAGKSTLAHYITRNALAERRSQPVAHSLLDAGGSVVLELGARRGSFSGTDALALNVQPSVLGWLRTFPAAYVFAEGDRLANDKFFAGVREMGYRLSIVYLALAEREAGVRRAWRAKELGTKLQNPSWVKGRVTKHMRLATAFNAKGLDGGRETAWLAEQLREEPVVRALRGEV